MKDKNKVLAQWILEAVQVSSLTSVGAEPKGWHAMYCKTATGNPFVAKYVMRP